MKKISLILMCFVLSSCLFGCSINQGATSKSGVSSMQSIEETSENGFEKTDEGSKDNETSQKKDDGNKNSSSNDGWGTDFPF